MMDNEKKLAGFPAILATVLTVASIFYSMPISPVRVEGSDAGCIPKRYRATPRTKMVSAFASRGGRSCPIDVFPADGAWKCSPGLFVAVITTEVILPSLAGVSNMLGEALE